MGDPRGLVKLRWGIKLGILFTTPARVSGANKSRLISAEQGRKIMHVFTALPDQSHTTLFFSHGKRRREDLGRAMYVHALGKFLATYWQWSEYPTPFDITRISQLRILLHTYTNSLVMPSSTCDEKGSLVTPVEPSFQAVIKNQEVTTTFLWLKNVLEYNS
jgi:hypothetical protein